MSYLAGNNGALTYNDEEFVWTLKRKPAKHVRWSDIRLVTTEKKGATVHLTNDDSVFLPDDIVWFEFLVEDIIEKARAANPDYEGPAPIPKPRDLTIPDEHKARLSYTRRAQRFYKDRCPSYEELKAFLEANLEWPFHREQAPGGAGHHPPLKEASLGPGHQERNGRQPGRRVSRRRGHHGRERHRGGREPRG